MGPMHPTASRPDSVRIRGGALWEADNGTHARREACCLNRCRGRDRDRFDKNRARPSAWGVEAEITERNRSSRFGLVDAVELLCWKRGMFVREKQDAALAGGLLGRALFQWHYPGDGIGQLYVADTSWRKKPVNGRCYGSVCILRMITATNRPGRDRSPWLRKCGR